MHMRFVVAATADRDPAELEPILHRRGVPGQVRLEPWRRGVELSGDGDMATVGCVLRAASEWAGPTVRSITLRVEGEEVDLLYCLPPADFESALAALPDDLDSVRQERDEWGRSWCHGRWTDSEAGRAGGEVHPEPPTARQILELFEGPQDRDWRAAHGSVERRATCADLVEAMALATTLRQRRLLAHLFTLRARPCPTAVLHLIDWLEDPDEHVARDAADALGLLLASIRNPGTLAAAQRAAGAPLLRYARAYPAPFVLTALGVTAHPPARAYLEELAADPDRPRLQPHALRALRNLDWYASPDNAGKAPPSRSA